MENHVKDLDVRPIKEISNPPTEVAAIEGLKVHEGFMCTFGGCNHLRATLTSIEKHCQREHEWTKSKGTYHIGEKY